jgi:hypothetical protein
MNRQSEANDVKLPSHEELIVRVVRATEFRRN